MKSVVKWVCDAWNAAPEELRICTLIVGTLGGLITIAFALAIFLVAMGEALGAFGVFLGFAIITLVAAGVTLIVGYLRQKR